MTKVNCMAYSCEHNGDGTCLKDEITLCPFETCKDNRRTKGCF